MKDTIFLIVNRRSVDRMVKSAGAKLERGERRIQVEVTVDDGIFEPRPELTATLAVMSAVDAEPGQIVLDPLKGLEREDGQGALNILTAKLLAKAINSSDESLQQMAIESLAVCKQHGVIVNISVPGEDS